jgi:hypothetical protein
VDDALTRLTCTGFDADGWSFPAFEVRAGELVRMVVPRSCILKPRAALQLLATPFARKGIQSSGKVVAVDFPLPRRWPMELFHRQRTIEWLCQKAKISRSVAERLLDRVKLSPETPLSWLAGTPRNLLAIQAALAERPAVILFDTVGSDPLGVRRVLQAVAEQLEDAAAVCLSVQDDNYVDEFPFDGVIKIHRHQAEAATY